MVKSAPAPRKPAEADSATLTPGVALLMAIACGVIVANLYYAQPLAKEIAAALSLPASSSGLVVTVAQIGYGLGLILLVPLGDRYENRRLILILIAVETLALVGAALSAKAVPFLILGFLIGCSAVAVQVIVPFASHFARPEIRGRVVGTVMSGLMLGIMLARPAASLVAGLWSWHVVFALSAGLMVVLAIALRLVLPTRKPQNAPSYAVLLRSMPGLVRTIPILRRRALYQACLFCAFSLFWTTVPMLLTGPSYGLSQPSVALFALVGVAGAVAAPIAGRVADRGWLRPASAMAMSTVALAFLITVIAPAGSNASLIILALSAILLDFGVTGNMVIGQRAIFALGGELRGRLNGIFMATFFLGGALGSAVGGWVFVRTGWSATALSGVGLAMAALLYFVTELRGGRS